MINAAKSHFDCHWYITGEWWYNDTTIVHQLFFFLWFVSLFLCAVYKEKRNEQRKNKM